MEASAEAVSAEALPSPEAKGAEKEVVTESTESTRGEQTNDATRLDHAKGPAAASEPCPTPPPSDGQGDPGAEEPEKRATAAVSTAPKTPVDVSAGARPPEPPAQEVAAVASSPPRERERTNPVPEGTLPEKPEHL